MPVSTRKLRTDHASQARESAQIKVAGVRLPDGGGKARRLVEQPEHLGNHTAVAIGVR